MIVIDNKYDIGEVVYLVTDPEQFKRIVIGITYYKGAELMYKLSCRETISEHYDFELNKEPDLTLK